MRTNIFYIDYLFFGYRKNSDNYGKMKDLFEDAIKHENANHQCKYFGSECPYKGIKFMEKVLLENNIDLGRRLANPTVLETLGVNFWHPAGPSVPAQYPP